tara:strand:- start:603 stop:1034 length:432 start_codon:yes stop_codon:yes gene_type:complete
MIKYLLCMFILMYSCTTSPRYTTTTIPNVSTTKIKSTKDKLRGVSSWYGPKFHGNLTANGEVYDMYGVTAAHKTLPFNTVVRVKNEDNGKSIILRINDRGPYAKGRILDCSFGAAKKLGFDKIGTANVSLEIIELGDGEYMHH